MQKIVKVEEPKMINNTKKEEGFNLIGALFMAGLAIVCIGILAKAWLWFNDRTADVMGIGG